MQLKNKCCTWHNGQVELSNHKWISTFLETSLTNGQHLKWLWCRGCHLYKLDTSKEKIKNIIST